jgi:4,5-DOPA dioxygenase extradiol
MGPNRRQFLSAAIAMLAAACRSRSGTTTTPSDGDSMSARDLTPVLFVGHGSPMHVVADNQWTRGFERIASNLERPSAIVCVSAHWFVDGILLTGGTSLDTIHDFGGFPHELYEIQYDAPGAPDLASRARDLIGTQKARIDDARGRDHGAWTVLSRMYPDADIPIIQLSIDRRLPPRAHIELGRALAPLREEGVLLVGSGNMTHNLRHAMRFVMSRQPREATPAYGASTEQEDVSSPIEGFDASSLSMRSVLFS